MILRDVLNTLQTKGESHIMAETVLKGRLEEMVEAAGIEPASEHELPTLLRACFTINSRLADCQ